MNSQAGFDAMHEGPELRSLKELLEEYERRLILAALEASKGHQRRAAKILGILPSTLVEKMKRLGIPGRRTAHRLRGAESPD